LSAFPLRTKKLTEAEKQNKGNAKKQVEKMFVLAYYLQVQNLRLIKSGIFSFGSLSSVSWLVRIFSTSFLFFLFSEEWIVAEKLTALETGKSLFFLFTLTRRTQKKVEITKCQNLSEHNRSRTH
jgi:hypothetical protein